ncbi:MAG: hypothetical protein H7062_25415 [Candidatus Saccharimonas sp.]|nr:hypothetical protein [Planctomycetaceae bacterium]
MMAAPSFGVGWLEVLFVLLGGSGLLGMPPGERDPSLLKAAPQQSLVYFEWAGRAAGQPGAAGIDGLAADPEIRAFFEALENAIAKAEYPDADEQQQRLQREIPKLVKLLTAHPGCLFIGFEPPLPGDGLLQALAPNEVIARFRIGLVATAGKDVEPLLETIAQLTESDVGKQPKLHEVSAGPMALKLTIHREADRVMIGFGEGTIAQALACLKGAAPGLDANPRFQAGWKRVASPRVATVGWLDLQGVFENVTRTAGLAGPLFQVVLRGLSADALDYVVTGSGVVGGDIVQRTFLATGGRTDGLLLLAGGPALRNEQLRHIPADCDLVAAGSLNLAQVVLGARELVGRTTPASAAVFDEAVKQLESELGLSLEQDVYPAIGDAWTAFDSPSEGGLIGSSLIVAVEVRDVDRAAVLFDHLMKLLAQSLISDADPDFGGKTAELKRQAFLGHTICYVNTVGSGLGSEAAKTPSFCLTRGHILFALHPQALKAHLRQQSVNRPGFDAVASKKLARPEGELLALGRLDGARALQALCALAPYFGQAVLSHLQSEGFPLDAFAIPSAAALLPYASDATFVVVRQKDGLLVETKNAHTAILTAAVFGSARSWFMPNYDEYLEARRQRGQSVQNAGLGAAEGQVVPAAAVQPAKPPEKPAAAAARVLTPLVIKAMVPDGVQQFIPNEVFQRLGQPPTPEEIQRREDRRKQIDERRRQRQQKRLPLPFPPPPQ